MTPLTAPVPHEDVAAAHVVVDDLGRKPFRPGPHRRGEAIEQPAQPVPQRGVGHGIGHGREPPDLHGVPQQHAMRRRMAVAGERGADLGGGPAQAAPQGGGGGTEVARPARHHVDQDGAVGTSPGLDAAIVAAAQRADEPRHHAGASHALHMHQRAVLEGARLGIVGLVVDLEDAPRPVVERHHEVAVPLGGQRRGAAPEAVAFQQRRLGGRGGNGGRRGGEQPRRRRVERGHAASLPFAHALPPAGRITRW